MLYTVYSYIEDLTSLKLNTATEGIETDVNEGNTNNNNNNNNTITGDENWFSLSLTVPFFER